MGTVLPVSMYNALFMQIYNWNNYRLIISRFRRHIDNPYHTITSNNPEKQHHRHSAPHAHPPHENQANTRAEKKTQ